MTQRAAARCSCEARFRGVAKQPRRLGQRWLRRVHWARQAVMATPQQLPCGCGTDRSPHVCLLQLPMADARLVNLQVSPQGVVEMMYPWQGNERAIGLDQLKGRGRIPLRRCRVRACMRMFGARTERGEACVCVWICVLMI